jgi:prepilin-type N-terminal cleavage/methylation domain-containing protein
MAMADSTPTSRTRLDRAGGRRAFTLVELLVAVGLSGLVLTGVLKASLHIMRSGVRLTHYAEMNTQVRRAFEQLAIDVKAASAFTYNSANDITVTVAESDGTSSQFTYAWNSSTLIFYRVAGASSAATTGRVQLMTGVSALSFSRLTTTGSAASTDNATKSLKIAITVARTATGAARSTSTAATTFTLRNKPVS